MLLLLLMIWPWLPAVRQVGRPWTCCTMHAVRQADHGRADDACSSEADRQTTYVLHDACSGAAYVVNMASTH